MQAEAITTGRKWHIHPAHLKSSFPSAPASGALAHLASSHCLAIISLGTSPRLPYRHAKAIGLGTRSPTNFANLCLHTYHACSPPCKRSSFALTNLSTHRFLISARLKRIRAFANSKDQRPLFCLLLLPLLPASYYSYSHFLGNAHPQACLSAMYVN